MSLTVERVKVGDKSPIYDGELGGVSESLARVMTSRKS